MGRVVKRQVVIYNLDILIAVGYRINSVVGTISSVTTKRHCELYHRWVAINKNIFQNYTVLNMIDDVKLLPVGIC